MESDGYPKRSETPEHTYEDDEMWLKSVAAEFTRRTGVVVSPKMPRRRPRRTVIAGTVALGLTAAIMGTALFWMQSSGNGAKDLTTVVAEQPDIGPGIAYLRVAVDATTGDYVAALPREREDEIWHRPDGTTTEHMAVDAEDGPVEEWTRPGGTIRSIPDIQTLQVWAEDPGDMLQRLYDWAGRPDNAGKELVADLAFRLLAVPTTPSEVRAGIVDAMVNDAGAVVREIEDENAYELTVNSETRQFIGVFDARTASLVRYSEVVLIHEPVWGLGPGETLSVTTVLESGIVSDVGETP